MFPVRMTSRTATAIVVALAAAAPAAYAVPARDTGGAMNGAATSGSYPTQLHRSGYLVSPDAQDAARQASVDRRSPDAIDAAGSRPASPSVIHVSRSVSSTDDSGFDWGDAGIGALAMLGIAGLGAGTATGVVRHRRRLQRPVTTG